MERTNTSRRSKPQVCEEIQVSTDGASGLKRARVAEKSPETVGKGAPSSKRRTVTEHKLENVEKHLPAILQGKKKIVVIVGAGISTSAGIPDFRSKDGLFRTLKKGGGGRHLFDASVYNDPQTTREFHEMVRKMSQLVKQVKPTPFHDMVAELAREGRLLRLYTQNIDGLETRLEFSATNLPLEPKSPWPVTIPLHGGLDQIRCTICSHIDVLNALIFQGSDRPSCPKCEETEKNRRQEGKRSRGIGYLRPRMVLYDEDNPDADAIGKVSKADLARIPDAVIVAGTSLQVPGTIRIAKEMCKATRSIDGITVWLNKEPPPSALRDLWDLELLCECDDSVAPLDLPMQFTSQDKDSELNRHAPREMSPVSMRSIRAPAEQRSDSTLVVGNSIEVAPDRGDQLASPDAPDQTVVTATEDDATYRPPGGTEHLETSPNEEFPVLANNAEANTPKIVRARRGGRRGRPGRPPGRPRGCQQLVPLTTDIAARSDSVSTTTDRRRKRLSKDEGEAETPAKRTRGRSVVIPWLPFRPEDLDRLVSTGEDSQLTDDVVNTLMRYIVACRPNLRTIPSSDWYTDCLGDNVLRCDNTTVFVLPVDVDGHGHGACLTIRVDQREATLIDPLNGQERTIEMCEELASRFVRHCLPEPFNNWDEEWKTAQPDPCTHTCELGDSRLYSLWAAMHKAAEMEVPSSFDSRLLRSWLYALCTNINHIAGAASVPGPALCLSGTTQVVSGTASKDRENLKKLSDVFEHQWSEYLKRDAEEAKTHFPIAGTLGPLQQLKQEKEIVERRVKDCISQLSRSQRFAKSIVTLNQALRVTDRKYSGILDKLDQADTTLTKETKSLLPDATDQLELDSIIQRCLELIGSHRDELKLFAQLEKALDGADAHAVEDYMRESIEELS